MTYTAPVPRILFDLEHIADLTTESLAAEGSDLDLGAIAQILDEAGRFAGSELAPLNRPGDIEGAKFENGVVRTPKGFREAYKAWAEAGWNAVDAPVAVGGMGLPFRIATVAMEMWTSACTSFSLGPVLSQGAADVLLFHGTEEQRRRYLPNLVSGAWMATMNLTEPQAGSDLGALRTKAERAGDGTYRISGQKIFITCGEHDYTDNIIHLVLARLPDAPPGTRGISLFLVPKFLVKEDGSLGAHNDVRCAGIEHKAGIHASPTCIMVYGDGGGATGYLIGEENRGLACMFTMMNKARLYTGLQGVAIGERALQQARSYALERRQGRAMGAPDGGGQIAIIEHPDVRRNLMTMRALTSAARAVAYATAGVIDKAAHATDKAARAALEDRASILTPITKAFCSEIGVEVASLGVQIHGGMGYVEETGAIQLWRDARIAPIYEGTNGIQAIDLVTRKITRAGGGVVDALLAEWRTIAAELGNSGAVPKASAARLDQAIDRLAAATRHLLASAQSVDALAVATPYLRLFSLVTGGAYLAKGAVAAARAGASTPVNVARDVVEEIRFYLDNILPMTAALAEMTEAGAASVLVPVESFR
jgi:alkylation response protein AidB-like acyl-CoA dehydrogenase